MRRTGSASGAYHAPNDDDRADTQGDHTNHGPERANQGLVACDERDLPRMVNPRLSARCRVSRTAANDRTWMSGLDRSEAGAEASRAKAQKGSPAASMDGSTAVRDMTGLITLLAGSSS
jgi:hypothetical protein